MEAVIGQIRRTPRELVGDALAFRVARIPQLQILRAVVRSLPVLVMNRLVGQHRAPDHPLHDNTVLGRIPSAHPNDFVSVLVEKALSLARRHLTVLRAKSLSQIVPVTARSKPAALRALKVRAVHSALRGACERAVLTSWTARIILELAAEHLGLLPALTTRQDALRQRWPVAHGRSLALSGGQ